MMLAILFSIKTMELLENLEQLYCFQWEQNQLASSQNCHSVDADAWCKQALTGTVDGTFHITFGKSESALNQSSFNLVL